MAKILVAYFSPTGTTAQIAKLITEITGADSYEIKPAVKYTNIDLNWDKQNSRTSIEMADVTSRPELADKNAKIADFALKFVLFKL